MYSNKNLSEIIIKCNNGGFDLDKAENILYNLKGEKLTTIDKKVQDIVSKYIISFKNINEKINGVNNELAYKRSDSMYSNVKRHVNIGAIKTIEEFKIKLINLDVIKINDIISIVKTKANKGYILINNNYKLELSKDNRGYVITL